jgi:hypothetical protein
MLLVMKRIVAGIIALAATQVAFAQGGFNGPGRYQIINLKSNRAISVDRDGRTVVQLSPRGDNSEWIVEPGPAGSWFFRIAMNGRALQITSNDKSTTLAVGRFEPENPGQQWRIEPGKDGNPMLTTVANGKVIDIPDGSSREGVRPQIYDRNGDSNQRFMFRRVNEDRGRERDRRSRWDRDHN